MQASEPDEPIELTGVVAGASGRWVVADLVVRGDGLSPETRVVREAFELEVEGRLVQIECGGAAIEGGKKAQVGGDWARVSATPLGALLSGFAAGPHLPVEIEARGFAAGDRVRIDGEVIEAEHAGGSYREGSRRDPSRVRARRIGAPAEPSAASRAGTIARVGAIVLLVALASLLAARGGASTLETLARGSWIAMALTLAWVLTVRLTGHLHVHTTSPRFSSLPQFSQPSFEGARQSHIRGLFAPIFLGLIGAVVLSMAAKHALALGGPAAGMWLGLSTIYSTVLAIGTLVVTGRRERAEVRIARTMLDARVASTAGWARLDGTLARPLRRVFRLRSIHEGGRGGWVGVESSEETLDSSALALDTPEGLVRVELSGARVAVSAWARRPTDERDEDGRPWTEVVAYEAPPGARALVVGPFDAGVFRAAGPESLLVFIGGTQAPHAQLARALAWRRARWVPIAASLAYIATSLVLTRA